jgi:hypothetical protein
VRARRGAAAATGSPLEISSFKSQILVPEPAEPRAGSADVRAASLMETKSISAYGEGPSLEESVERFWELDPEIEAMQFIIAGPPVEAAPVKRLGQPPFWNSKLDFISEMESAYNRISEAAIRTALGE